MADPAVPAADPARRPDGDDDSYPIDKGRLTSFSDNVISIAMTLLVLDVRVPPDLGQLTVMGVARLMAPRLFGFTLSFTIVGVFWVGHHLMMRGTLAAPRSVLWSNNLFLLLISLVPASAALLGGYPGQRASVVLYGANLAGVGGALVLMWHQVVRYHHRAGLPISASIVRSGYLRSAGGAGIALAGMALAVVNPWASYAVYCLAPAGYVVLQVWPSNAGTRPQLAASHDR